MRDYSEIHQLAGKLFAWPQDASAWEPFRLSQEQVSHFHEHGYVAGVRLLNDAQVAALRDALQRLLDPNHPAHALFYEFHSNESHDPSTVLFHALGAWRAEEAFHDILWNPAYLLPAAQLLGGSVRFWHDQLFSKPANHGGVVAWHQDYSYWTRTQPMAHLTCWIGLDDSTTENGCLQYIPGSHRWNLLPITGLTGNMDEIKTVLTEEQREQFQPVAIELRAGECAFHHPLLVHGSFENRSPRPRRAAVINVFRDGVCSDANESLLEGVPAIPRGEVMGGQFFPLLLNPTAEGVTVG
ncbi:MAG: phytanoyl-CoA dioxygenase family protein [Bryobacterales bacterium]|nr:phytanoyl-CoA dioxygenase family protein [Bryobacterales bacterium]